MTPNDDSNGPAARCPEEFLLEDYHRGVLEHSSAERLRGHIDECATCRFKISESTYAEKVGELLREAHRDVPPELRERLIAEAMKVLPSGDTT